MKIRAECRFCGGKVAFFGELCALCNGSDTSFVRLAMSDTQVLVARQNAIMDGEL